MVFGFFFSGDGVRTECRDALDDLVDVDATDVESPIVVWIVAVRDSVVGVDVRGRL